MTRERCSTCGRPLANTSDGTACANSGCTTGHLNLAEGLPLPLDTGAKPAAGYSFAGGGPTRHQPHTQGRVSPSKHYPPRKEPSPDGSWGRHWLPRAEQAAFRKQTLAREGHICFYCGATNKPLQAHHVTCTHGHMACQSCHNRETQANQLRGNPPPLP